MIPISAAVGFAKRTRRFEVPEHRGDLRSSRKESGEDVGRDLREGKVVTLSIKRVDDLTGVSGRFKSASTTSFARSRCLPGLRLRARTLNWPLACRPRT